MSPPSIDTTIKIWTPIRIVATIAIAFATMGIAASVIAGARCYTTPTGGGTSEGAEDPSAEPVVANSTTGPHSLTSDSEAPATGTTDQGLTSTGVEDVDTPAIDPELNDSPPIAEGDLKAECMAGIARSCNRLGYRYLKGTRGQKQSFSDAAYYMRAGCELGDPLACQNLAYLYKNGKGLESDHERAFELYSRACDSGVGQACTAMASLQYAGKGTRRDRSEAVRTWQSQCEIGNRLACWYLSRHYRKRGDATRAEEYQTLACMAGMEGACSLESRDLE